MLAKQPASLGGFEFDAIIKRSETMTSDVPEYATEEGYSITDNNCDDEADLQNINSAPMGAQALVIHTGNIYIADSTGKFYPM